MSQESDTQNDSKPVRLKLSKKSDAKADNQEPSPASTTEPASTPAEVENESPKTISLKKKVESAPESSTQPTPETPPTQEEASAKKQIPLKRKKPQADPLLDPNIEIAFHEKPKPAQPEPTEPPPQAPELEATPKRKPLGLKPKPKAEDVAQAAPTEPIKPAPSEQVESQAEEPEDPLPIQSGPEEVTPSSSADTSKNPAQENSPADKHPKEEVSGGKKSLLITLLIILFLTLLGAGSVIIMMNALGSDETETNAPPAVVKTSEPKQEPPETAKISKNSPAGIIKQAKNTIAAVNELGEGLEKEITEAPQTTAQADPVAEPPVESVAEPEPRIVTVPEQTVEQTLTVIEAQGDATPPAPALAENAENQTQGTARTSKPIGRDPEVTLWLKALYIPSHSANMQKISIGASVYQKGDLINEDLQLTLYHVSPRIVYIEDATGAIYQKTVK